MYRQIQATDLKSVYASDAEFAPKMRHLSALAFVPVDDVVHAFEFLL